MLVERPSLCPKPAEHAWAYISTSALSALSCYQGSAGHRVSRWLETWGAFGFSGAQARLLQVGQITLLVPSAPSPTAAKRDTSKFGWAARHLCQVSRMGLAGSWS